MEKEKDNEKENGKKVEKLHLVGVTCMFMAGKYEEIKPIRIRTMVEKIAHKKIKEN